LIAYYICGGFTSSIVFRCFDNSPMTVCLYKGASPLFEVKLMEAYVKLVKATINQYGRHV
jgi:hypothetical protein